MADSREIPKHPMDILRAALSDPQLDIEYIGLPNYEKIFQAIAPLPEDALISEWEHREGGIKFEYHMHTNGIREPLKKVYEDGIRGGNPWLTRLYSIPEHHASPRHPRSNR